ncbi:MAG: hypothetical protein N3J91_13930 [Verrucomicrobiae bacterium]|nr:hypothetical protein [Verrucomicrobiae bacterium]
MDVTHQPTFDALLQAAKLKAPGSLKTPEIKRLLKAAGKRPTNAQVTQIADLIAGSPGNQALVYEILGDLETAAKPHPKLVLLKPALWRITCSWFSRPPPEAHESEPMLAWLRSQCARSPDGEPITVDRLRGVSLVLIARFRNPETFLKCLREVGLLVREALSPEDKKRATGRSPRNGFVMSNLARALFTALKGEHPRFSKVVEISSTVETVLTHLQERESTANAAIMRLEQVEGALTEQRRTIGEQAETIRKLESEIARMQTQVTNLTAEVSRWKHLHEQAINHANSMVAEGKKMLLADLQSKILPKIGDARLYANRPVPAVDQIVRLLGEMEQVLQAKEG